MARRSLFVSQKAIELGGYRIFSPAVAGVAFSLAHTYLMAITRQIISPLVGLGSYDYGIMFYRYPMELSNDLVGSPASFASTTFSENSGLRRRNNLPRRS